jgi:hypothetical protein
VLCVKIKLKTTCLLSSPLLDITLRQHTGVFISGALFLNRVWKSFEKEKMARVIFFFLCVYSSRGAASLPWAPYFRPKLITLCKNRHSGSTN